MRYRTEMMLGLGVGALLFAAGLGVNIFPLVLLLVLAALVATRFGTTQGKAGTLVKATVDKKVSFADIGGQWVAKQELLEALNFINQMTAIRKLGIRPLKGILLSGPPGTGKTLLAKAAAAYTDSVFLAASGSEFVEMYAGVGAQRVRQMFDRARNLARNAKKTKAVVFIDEIEVLGGQRGRHSSHLEYDQTLNQLLVEMDGISAATDIQVLVIGATNRADLLDEALLRPGRFDRHVRVDLPDKEARIQILRVHTRNKPLAADVDLEVIARESYGFSGAHLESLANEAAILALRKDEEQIRQVHFMTSIEKVLLGETEQRRPPATELRRVALHEAGHALVAEHVRPGSVASVTVLSRGGALGYVRQTADDDSTYLLTEKQIREQLWVLLGGAIAEELVLGNRSTGARGDFKKAIELARSYVLSGMSPLGIVDESVLSKTEFHQAQQELLQEITRQVRSLLQASLDMLYVLGDKLQEEEWLTGRQLRRLLRENLAEQAASAVGN